MKILALIPARYGSTRFEGKPLADILGKSMIERVYERSSSVFSDCYVATDDARIYDCVMSFGGKAVMTSSEHKSGTDRCFEAFETICKQRGESWDVVVNIQGDEPFIAVSQLEQLRDLFLDTRTQIATLVKPFVQGEDIDNPNSPKVVVDKEGFALYFSRSVVPFLRGVDLNKWSSEYVFLKHIGLYGYRADVLKAISTMPQGVLEVAESLEQLRWLENGLKIKTAITTQQSYSIDTPEDLAFVLEHFKK